MPKYKKKVYKMNFKIQHMDLLFNMHSHSCSLL